MFARRAVDAEAQTPDVAPSGALITRFKLAEALLQVGRAEDALVRLEAIEREAAAVFPATSVWLGDFALRQGQALAATGRHDEARTWVQRAIDRYGQAEGVAPDHLERARAVWASLLAPVDP